MTAYTTRMDVGFPGDLSRGPEHATVITYPLDQTTPPPMYGVAVKLITAGGVTRASGLAQSDVALSVRGVLVRDAPTTGGTTSETPTTEVPNKAYPGSVMTFGVFTTKCWAGTPVAGGAVYIYNGAPVANGIQPGCLQANAAGGVIYNGMTWVADGLDSNSCAEVRLAFVPY